MSFVELTWAICYYILQYCTEVFISSTKEEVSQRIKPRFLLRCTAGNSNKGGSYWIYKGSVSLWEYFATRSPERSWNLCPWGFSTPNWIKPWATWSEIDIEPVSNGEKTLQLHSKSCLIVIGKDTQTREHREHFLISHGAVQLIM